MKQHQPSHQVIGRRTRLATCLGLALALGTGSVLAASPDRIHQATPAATQQTVLTRGAVSGQTTLPATATNRSTSAASLGGPVIIINVSNCNDSGAYSLRSAIGQAPSGATIDMSGVPGDCTISLQSSIITSVDDLTIKGKANSKYPIIDGQHNVTPIVHYGAGTLTLTDTTVYNGTFTDSGSSTFGGCVASFGNVKLIGSDLKYCTVENTGGGIAKGAGIASNGNVTLSNSTISLSTARNSGSGDAQGGAIWSQGTTELDDASEIASNTAEAQGAGDAKGGGLYSTGTLSLFGDSKVSDNEAIAADGDARGGGTYAPTTVAKYSMISGNGAESTSGRGLGGGISANTSLSSKYSTVATNHASSTNSISTGGGIHASGDILIKTTTISGNSAQRIGGIVMSGSNATQPLEISSSTVSGNTATNSVFGAGIYMGYDGSIANSTITGNIESNSADSKYGAGLSLKHGVTVDLSSTIVSENILKHADDTELPSDIDAATGNDSGTVLSGDYNLIGFTSISYPGSHGIQSFSPGLEALADNGGPTKTHALTPTSQAINAGVSNSFTNDQRGTGFARSVGSAPDIGAFEYGGDDVIFANGFE